MMVDGEDYPTDNALRLEHARNSTLDEMIAPARIYVLRITCPSCKRETDYPVNLNVLQPEIKYIRTQCRGCSRLLKSWLEVGEK